MVFMILYVFDVANSTKVTPLSFFSSSRNLTVAVSTGSVLFSICALKSPVTIVFGLVSLKSHQRRCRRYVCFLLNMMLLVHILALSIACSALLCTQNILLLWG